MPDRYGRRDEYDRYRGRDMRRWGGGDRERGWRNQNEGYRRDYEDPFYDRGSSPRYERGYGYQAGYGPDLNENDWRRGRSRHPRYFEGPPPGREEWREPRGYDREEPYRGEGEAGPYPDRDRAWRDRERWGEPPRETGRGYGRGAAQTRGGEYEGRGYPRRGDYERVDRDTRDFMDRGWGVDYDYEDEPVPYQGRSRNDRSHVSDFDDYRYGSGRYGGDRNW
ncbi:MAG: hypothetical protein ACRD2J_10290 [Thermoanaerobaculia bacterium]